MECSGKGSLTMKTKLFVSLLLLTAAVAPRALAAADGGDRNLHPGRGQLLVTPVDDPGVKDVPPKSVETLSFFQIRASSNRARSFFSTAAYASLPSKSRNGGFRSCVNWTIA